LGCDTRPDSTFAQHAVQVPCLEQGQQAAAAVAAAAAAAAAGIVRFMPHNDLRGYICMHSVRCRECSKLLEYSCGSWRTVALKKNC
jgi:hypothetical protein